MTKKHLTLLTTVVLTALILAGCGRTRDSVVESSAPEGINTFGVDVNPSTQPSTGQVLPATTSAGTVTDPAIGGGDNYVVENNSAPAASTAPGNDLTTETSPSPSKAPSSGGSTTAPQPSSSDEPLPSPSGIVPPAPVSSATVDDVMRYVGKTPKELIEDHGYPTSSTYDYVDENDPDAGEIGTMYYPTFTVKTMRKDGIETITSVTPKETPSPAVVSPEA